MSIKTNKKSYAIKSKESFFNENRKKMRSEDKTRSYFNKNLGHNPISFILSIIGIGVMLYIYFKYNGSNDYTENAYAQYSFMLAMFGIIGFLFVDSIDDYKITVFPKNFKKSNYISVIIKTMVVFIIMLSVQYIFQYVLRFALTDIDMILYYLFASICEELFFRALIIGGSLEIKRLYSKRISLERLSNGKHLLTSNKNNNKNNNNYNINVDKHIFNILISIISAIIFMYAHIGVYGSDISLMMATLGSGIILGLAYAYWNDLSVNQLAHFINNINAVRSLLVTF